MEARPAHSAHGARPARRAGRSQPISATRGAIFSATCWANSTGWRSGISSISATPSSAYAGHVAKKRVHVSQRRPDVEHGLLDAVVVAALGRAVLAQHVELMGDVGECGAEDVARVGVPRHQPQRLLLAAAADHDRRPGSAQRRRHAQRLGELVVPPLVRPVVVAPHLLADLQRLLQPLEPLADRHHRHAQAALLPLVPGRADAQPGPAAGQHVQRGDDLRQQPGMPVHHAGDEHPERHPLGLRGDVAERRVRLQHRLLGRAPPPPSGSSGP